MRDLRLPLPSLDRWPRFRVLARFLLDRLPKVEIVPIEIDAPKSTHPWQRFAGMFQDDPLFDQVLEDVETYRRELDGGPHRS